VGSGCENGYPGFSVLRIAAGAARRPALLPQLFPIPDPVRHLVGQGESELMREHTHLPAMVGFVRKHVAQHFRASRPRPSPAVSAKFLDAAPRTAERFGEHLRAASGAFCQCRTGLPRRAVRAVELWWNLQVRSCKPDPLGADIVQMREDRRNGTALAGRVGFPGGRVNIFDENLVDAIISGKDPDRGWADLSAHLLLTRGHGSIPPTCNIPGPPAIGKQPNSFITRNRPETGALAFSRDPYNDAISRRRRTHRRRRRYRRHRRLRQSLNLPLLQLRRRRHRCHRLPSPLLSCRSERFLENRH
jgi:hypothetical protein